MKNNSDHLLAILNSHHLAMFSIATFHWNSLHRYTDFGRDVVYNGNHYSGDSPMVSASALRYNNVVNREAFEIQLDGLDQNMITEVEAGIVHKKVEMRVLFLNPSTNEVYDGVNQSMYLYSGEVSGTEILWHDGQKLINIECTAPLSNLDATGTIFTTKSGMQPLSSNDTCFDKIHTQSEEVMLRWGK